MYGDQFMPRPKRKRVVFCEPDYVRFYPEGIPPSGDVILSVDEYEMIRLVDLRGLTHAEAADSMQISRTTATEIYQSARFKIADCIVNGRPLIIGGGDYCCCGHDTGGDTVSVSVTGHHCGCHGGTDMDMKGKLSASINEHNKMIIKGDNQMRIAVTYEDGNVFQHFGHTEKFKFYDTAGGKIITTSIVDTNGSGHGALAGFLVDNQVDVLICGGIGGGAQEALREAGIMLYGGVSGEADKAVEALMTGALQFDPNAHCEHHGEHGEGEGHHCGHHGEHGHGEGHHCGHHGEHEHGEGHHCEHHGEHGHGEGHHCEHHGEHEHGEGHHCEHHGEHGHGEGHHCGHHME